MKKTLLLITFVACTIGGSIAAIVFWRAHVVVKLEERAFECANKLLQGERPQEALAVINEQPRSDTKHRWSKVELDALVAAGQIPQLAKIYSRTPQRLLASESASLLVARAFLAAHQRDELVKLRAAWRGRELRQELWLALDADQLDSIGKNHEAEQLLQTKKFVGEAEATRLVRLALHAANRNLYEAWTLLDRAYAVDPRNPEIRSFRADILESIHKPAEARVEYVAALVADPKNPLTRDALAEFYRRQGSYDLALQTWREAKGLSAPDFIMLKEAFWSRVIQTSTSPVSHPQIPGALTPLVDFIQSLPAGNFWDADAFARLPQNTLFARERQEIFWLQLIDMLNAGQEKQAAEFLRVNRFRSRSWQPELQASLAAILKFRAHQPLVAADGLFIGEPGEGHQFFGQLDTLVKRQSSQNGNTAVPPDLAAILYGKNAFSAAFLAAGWREAAIALSRPPAADQTPVWFTYGIAQSIRFNRGNAAALEYLAKAPSTVELVGLRGELLLAEKHTFDGRRELETIAANDSDAGYRAAWLLSQSAIESREFSKARAILQNNPRLSVSVTGQEMLARIALLEGNPAEAERLYLAIENSSTEAQAFIARRAFERKDWVAARRVTERLQQQMPDELQLRENLLAIAKAEKEHANR